MRFANCKLQIYLQKVMKKHNGIRPQDVVILLTILTEKGANNKQIARLLNISESEISDSLYRSEYAGLITDIKNKQVNKRAFLDFLIYGIRYVFPTRPGAVSRGIPTAHSAEPLKSLLTFDENYVWADPEGNIRGHSIEPLYATLPGIVTKSGSLYELLALVDAVRTGSARTVTLAREILENRIVNS